MGDNQRSLEMAFMVAASMETHSANRCTLISSLVAAKRSAILVISVWMALLSNKRRLPAFSRECG